MSPDDLGEPGPNKYRAEKDERTNVAHSFGSKGKPAYPIILNYVEHSMAKDIPAAHKFTGPSVFSNNSGPKSSIGQRLKDIVDNTPGPNKYRPDKPTGHIPQFTLTAKLDKSLDNGIPGPGAYNINKKPKTPQFKMTGRPRIRKTETTPGPNAYNLAAVKTKTRKGGPTLKGRPSPFVYSGFRNTSKVSTLCS